MPCYTSVPTALVPPTHIGILPVNRLLPNLAALCRELSRWGQAGTLPSSVVLATGPSRSSDIEGTIVRGVHGPGEIHVVLVSR